MSSAEGFLIKRVVAREVLDSRGNPTVEVEIFTDKASGLAIVPSGASTGSHEALELRDGDPKRFMGKGVQKAVRNVSELIAPRVLGMDVREQRAIDELMLRLDGTENKSRIGANAILGVSLAAAKAAANTIGEPLFRYLGGEGARVLPVPLMNVINGGRHAGNELSIQEFMVVPVGAESFSEALRMGCEVYYSLKKILTERYGRSAVNVGDEGGFAPPAKTTHEALETLIKAVKEAGYTVGEEVLLGIDAAATEFYDGRREVYIIDGMSLSRERLIDYYVELVEEYPICSIEDPLNEEDFEGFSVITKRLGERVQIVGDDLFVTNVNRIRMGMEVGAANALLLKVNQIGSLTEARDAAELCMKGGYGIVVSHRSGETEDTTISDLTVALGTGQLKSGAPARGERTAKYNRLLRIEEAIGEEAVYPGVGALKRGR